MSRLFRVYQKKRGNRRTGSRALGSFGELVFFGLFLLIGCAGLVVMVTTLLIPEWRVNHEFVETTCVILAKQIGSQDGEDGTLYRPEIEIEYQIAGKQYRTRTYDITGTYSSGRADKEKILKQFDIGKRYDCWYDPRHPEVAVLVRGYSVLAWVLLAVPGTFILIGGGGFIYRLLHWGKSAERCAAGGKATDIFERRGRAPSEYPSVPVGADMTNSPGTRLKYRLPISTSATWALVGIGLFCLFWNGFVLVASYFVTGGFFGPGKIDWIPFLILIPFMLVGIVLIGAFIRQLLITTGVGQTFVEISDHPLFPGERYDLLVSQAGRLQMNSLVVILVCEESATYQQGTDTRTETSRVYEQELFRRESFEIHRGLPLEERFQMDVPAGMMHSFKSDHNEVSWKVVVKGDVDHWPDYERSYPVIVYPSSSDEVGREGSRRI
ncbi:MAG: DUF3592 domain-containing protein [Pirellulales bacterium]|nr:DUF3592 domain-containing protein [Pirellulales bacterium]